MENNDKTQGKIIIEFQPEGEVNPKTNEPCEGSITIQLNVTLSASDKVMALHALANSFAHGGDIETLFLLDMARSLCAHSLRTGESWFDAYAQTPDGTLIDRQILEALRKKGESK
jgi:hypothetical protein